MSICSSGLDAPCHGQPVTIDVAATHPLIQLAQVIPWPTLAALVLPDLKHSTAKGQMVAGPQTQAADPLGGLPAPVAL